LEIFAEASAPGIEEMHLIEASPANVVEEVGITESLFKVGTLQLFWSREDDVGVVRAVVHRSSFRRRCASKRVSELIARTLRPNLFIFDSLHPSVRQEKVQTAKSTYHF
jgi:hypothetical protein